jgi:hypothetical protein
MSAPGSRSSKERVSRWSYDPWGMRRDSYGLYVKLEDFEALRGQLEACERHVKILTEARAASEPPDARVVEHMRELVADYDKRVAKGVDPRFGSAIVASRETIEAMRAVLTKGTEL